MGNSKAEDVIVVDGLVWSCGGEDSAWKYREEAAVCMVGSVSVACGDLSVLEGFKPNPTQPNPTRTQVGTSSMCGM